MRTLLLLVTLAGCATTVKEDGPNVAGTVKANPACLVSCKTSVVITSVRDNEGSTQLDKDTDQTNKTAPK